MTIENLELPQKQGGTLHGIQLIYYKTFEILIKYFMIAMKCTYNSLWISLTHRNLGDKFCFTVVIRVRNVNFGRILNNLNNFQSCMVVCLYLRDNGKH